MSFWQDFGALFTPSEKTKLAGIDAGADVTGSNPPQAHGASVHTDRTRTMFIGAHYHTTGGTDEVGVGLDPDTDEKVAYRFQLPSDFSSLTSVQIAYSEAASDPAEHSWVLDVDVKIGVPPYVWFQHGGTDNGNVVSIGAYEEYFLDYFTIDSSCFTNIDANDICAIIITRDANNVSDTFIRDVMIQGIKITYAADM